MRFPFAPFAALLLLTACAGAGGSDHCVVADTADLRGSKENGKQLVCSPQRFEAGKRD